MTGTEAVLAILPAGTANLLATNLQVPTDLTDAVRVGLKGERRRFDTGSVNGEHFALMAGAGFDARMIKQAGQVAGQGPSRRDHDLYPEPGGAAPRFPASRTRLLLSGARS